MKGYFDVSLVERRMPSASSNASALKLSSARATCCQAFFAVPLGHQFSDLGMHD